MIPTGYTFTTPPVLNGMSNIFAKPKAEKEVERIDNVTIITDRKEDTMKPFLESKLKGFLGYKVPVTVICIDSEIAGTRVEVYPTELGGLDDVDETRTFIEKCIS